MESSKPVLCPSAQPEWEGSQIISVVVGTVNQPEMLYLDKPQPVSAQLLDAVKPASPAEVFRFSAPCANTGCRHYSAEASQCNLAAKVVRWIPKVAEKLPPCSIRRHCRWHQQEGAAACFRCPQVVTNNVNPTDAMQKAANPDVI